MSNVITLLKNKNNNNLDNEILFFIKNNIYSCFWDNFSFNENSIYIGKLIDGIKIPNNETNMNKYLDNLISCLNKDEDVYMKLYITKNIYNGNKTINLLIVNNSIELNDDIKCSLLFSMFEIYKVTENMINTNKDFKSIIEYYLSWNNYYNNSKLLMEKEY